MASAKFYPWFYAILMAITPSTALSEVMEMWHITEQKVRERIASPSNRPDIIGQILKSRKDSTVGTMSHEQMEVNAMMLVAAGSESVTTVLVGILNYLLRSPGDLAAVTDEIRTTFTTRDEIAGPRLKQLPILNVQDNRSAFNPFSLGPHNCPGQNLAWLELRLILAKFLWTFELDVSPGIDLPVWETQGIWWFWDKQPIIICLTRRS